MSDYDFTPIVHTLCKIENIQNGKLEYKYSSNKGDGYLGNIRAVQLVGTNKQLDVVFKFSHRDPKSHETVPLRQAYLIEINFYENIAPAFSIFQTKHQIKDPFNNYAKFYACVKDPLNELLVLENLKTQNYDLWNRKQPMNKEHLEYALATFAKFHGTSFAMQKLDPDLYRKVSQNLDEFDFITDLFEKMKITNQLSQSIQSFIHVFDSNTEAIYKEKLEKFIPKISDEMKACLQYRNKDIIIQGDCWCNNAMYQYKDLENRTKPVNMKILDFQAMRLGPPTLDLAYFFYSIAPKKALDDIEYYQKYYYTSLSEHLHKFGIDIDDIYDYNEFMKDWKNTAKFGLMLCIIVSKMMFTESQDALDITKDVDNFVSDTKIPPENEKEYYQKMKNIVMHFVDKDFI